jgi:hypothetical protein
MLTPRSTEILGAPIDMLCLLWNPKVHLRPHKRTPMGVPLEVLKPYSDSPIILNPGIGCSAGRVNCRWPSPAQLFLVPNPVGLMSLWYSLTTLGVVQLWRPLVVHVTGIYRQMSPIITSTYRAVVSKLLIWRPFGFYQIPTPSQFFVYTRIWVTTY